MSNDERNTNPRNPNQRARSWCISIWHLGFGILLTFVIRVSALSRAGHCRLVRGSGRERKTPGGIGGQPSFLSRLFSMAGSKAGTVGPRPFSARERQRKKIAGYTTSSITVEVMTPPIIGVAMRFITSAPAPWLQRIGASPAIITAAVMALGRTRLTAP